MKNTTIKTTIKKSKKTVRKHLQRLTKALQEANNIAWSTVSRPGPCFSNTEPGPDKDQAWAEHCDDLQEDQEFAAQLCREAVAAAPKWLRDDSTIIGRAFDKVFAKGGVCTAGPGIPSLSSCLSERHDI